MPSFVAVCCPVAVLTVCDYRRGRCASGPFGELFWLAVGSQSAERRRPRGDGQLRSVRFGRRRGTMFNFLRRDKADAKKEAKQAKLKRQESASSDR